MRTSLLIIHGPNLNLLGNREPEIYGSTTLEQINEHIQRHAEKRGFQALCVQTNYEGKIVELLQEAGNHAAVILNPAAYTHTSVAIRDAIAAITTPVIEIHLSQISGREAFRQTSLTAPVCAGMLSGFGWQGYLLAIDAAVMLTA
ncbi:MAG: type II 3-dehydroquinate dehydratase [Deltaproteobacteria bacterium]|nr:type II 3-dehydroquinate dehydratase [Candidatus Anaeroferrophillus wilburensis]MBN2889354.1 type II 3-dehydroquinate dehydratase [Deltaproteobacteria bacterium]